LALLNSPKEIVFGTGVNIGGRGVGIWAADNTQMFYPDTVAPQKIVEAMLFAQSKIKEGTVQIGIGAHYGEFYELGGGMYGAEADFVEEFAENDTEGGEIAITESIIELLEDKDAFELTHRQDLDGKLQKVFSVANGPIKEHSTETDEIYPIPYSREFYDDLIVFQKSCDEKHLKKMNEKYLKEKVVVLLERERSQYPSLEIGLLYELSLMALSKKFAVELLATHGGKEIKTAGNLGIYTFDDHVKAIEFAKEIRAELEKEKIKCRMGIDFGPIAVFDLPKGGRDIAGSPVNIASKMSQDFGKMGKIYLTKEVFEKVKPEGFEPIEIEVSKIEIESYEG